MSVYDGIICDDTVTVRGIWISSANPGSLNGKDLYILPFDDDIVGQMDDTQLEAYKADETNYGIVKWRPKANPKDHWAVPFVTGKKYYLRFEHGLDFENIQFNRQNWVWNTENEGGLWFVMPHYDVREAVYVDDNNGYRHLNDTIGGAANIPYLEMGDNVIYNDTDTREINFIINGKDYYTERLSFEGVRCIGQCQPPIEDEELELEFRYWSNASHWGDFGKVPEEGDEVIIESSWNMIYDIEESPKLKSLEIRGKLTFENNGTDRSLSVYNLWVRSGELEIGNITDPFTANALITLLGDNTEEYFAFTNSIEAGNKNLVVTGTANLYGTPRDTRTRLMESIYVGDKESYVDKNLDWKSGEKIVIAPTNMRTMDWDEFTIDTYDPANGHITFVEEATGFHFGAWSSTESDYGVDMRGEVAIMNRNIVITASQDDIDSVLKEPW